jgi:hypothetical protein
MKAFLERMCVALPCLGFACSPSVADSINLVQNGGFETGDCTGWLGGCTVVQAGQFAGLVPHSGNYFSTHPALSIIGPAQSFNPTLRPPLQLTFSYAFQGTQIATNFFAVRVNQFQDMFIDRTRSAFRTGPSAFYWRAPPSNSPSPVPYSICRLLSVGVWFAYRGRFPIVLKLLTRFTPLTTFRSWQCRDQWPVLDCQASSWRAVVFSRGGDGVDELLEQSE